MPRPKNHVPTYRFHSQSGRGRATWTDAGGRERSVSFPGEFESPESIAAYRRFVAEFAAGAAAVRPDPGGLAIVQLLLAYLEHARKTYRSPDGEPTDEVRHVETVIDAVNEPYGPTPAASFGPKELKAVRQTFIDRGWCRKTVNAQTNRVRRIFKWAVSEELVPPHVLVALAAVEGLKAGRTAAPERDPVRPVDKGVVRATLPHLNRHVGGLVRFMLRTGCRPSEAARVRIADINTAGEVWEYRPRRHKTAWKGKTRVIRIGPKGQKLLKEFMTDDPGDYLFSPARATTELRSERAAKRKTPKWPSHVKRNAAKRVARPKRAPTQFYTRQSILTAITRACDKAFPPPAPLGQQPGESKRTWQARLTQDDRVKLAEWRRAHRWFTYRLRHTVATDVARVHGIEAAGLVLGHAKIDTTQIYVERDSRKANEVAMSRG